MRPRNRRGRPAPNSHTRATQPENVVRVPHDSVNEMVLIAAVIVDESARNQYLRTLPPDMFYGTGHALIWKTLQEMHGKGLYYDPATLRQMGGPDIDVAHVETLIEQRPALPPNLKHHVEMLHWDHARVSAAKGPVTRFLEMIKDPKTDPQALRSAVDAISSSLASGTNHSLRNPRQLVEEQSAKIAQRMNGLACYPFGIEGLDFYAEGMTRVVDGEEVPIGGDPRLIPGTAPGQLTCVTGVSGGGKTTVTARAVLNMYLSGRRITYGAFEQGSGASLELLAAMALGMSRTDLSTGRIDATDHRLITKEMEAISEKVLFDEIPFEKYRTRDGNPNARAIDRVAQSIVDSRCDVYVADLFKRTLTETDPDSEEHALYLLQAVAQRLKVHIVMVQQQNLKQVLATKSKLPTVATIKGSGGWVEVSDTILGWHNPSLFKNIPNDTIYSLVLKQRHGPYPMMIRHEWDPDYGVIEGGEQVEMQREGDLPDTEDGFWGVGQPADKKG